MENNSNLKILISGAGITGLTLAYWLKKHGFKPTIVEIAPKMRDGGYMIDFWGVGYTVAEKMGILPDLRKEFYRIDRLNYVNGKNKITGGLNIGLLRKMINYRHLNVLRSGLEKVLYNNVKGKVKIRFGTSIKKIQETRTGVKVIFTKGKPETFDLVIGADGLRSNTRRIVFGPDEKFEKYLGYYTAAYTLKNSLDRAFFMYNIPNKQVAIYSVKNKKLTTFFMFKSENHGHMSTTEKKKLLKDEFVNAGWISHELVDGIDSSDDFFFDAVSQIRMPKWSKGRVALAGDASHAVSLIAGEGSGLGMTGAYILAGELKRHSGDHEMAYKEYERKMRPEITRKQEKAIGFANSFVPPSSFTIFVRNMMSKIPYIQEILMKNYLKDKIELEDY